jgi:hypothetical protein
MDPLFDSPEHRLQYSVLDQPGRHFTYDLSRHLIGDLGVLVCGYQAYLPCFRHLLDELTHYNRYRHKKNRIQRLTVTDFNQPFLGDLFAALEKNPSINFLGLEYNNKPQMFHLSSFIQRPSFLMLKSLSLRCNRLEDEQFKPVAAAFLTTANCSLEYLDLSRNELGLQPEYHQSIGSLMKKLTTLRYLNLEGNNIFKDQADVIMSALEDVAADCHSNMETLLIWDYSSPFTLKYQQVTDHFLSVFYCDFTLL